MLMQNPSETSTAYSATLPRVAASEVRSLTVSYRSATVRWEVDAHFPAGVHMLRCRVDGFDRPAGNPALAQRGRRPVVVDAESVRTPAELLSDSRLPAGQSSGPAIPTVSASRVPGRQRWLAEPSAR